MSIRAIPPSVALISRTDRIDADDLAYIAAALQRQVTRDFEPVWHATCSVSAFPGVTKVPAGHWPMFIVDSMPDAPGALGYHTDENGQPLAYVLAQDALDTATTCSHELLETLADPFGRRLVLCTMPDGRRMRVLVEVCDPPEAYTYNVQGLPMSDFVYPEYYGPHRWGAGVKDVPGPSVTFLNRVARPLAVAKGGYLSYVDAEGYWWQTTWFSGPAPRIRNISAQMDAARAAEPGLPLRAYIDRITPEANEHIGVNHD